MTMCSTPRLTPSSLWDEKNRDKGRGEEGGTGGCNTEAALLAVRDSNSLLCITIPAHDSGASSPAAASRLGFPIHQSLISTARCIQECQATQPSGRLPAKLGRSSCDIVMQLLLLLLWSKHPRANRSQRTIKGGVPHRSCEKISTA
jgi:hypothetical protein